MCYNNASPVDILQKLIRLPSVTPDGKACFDLLQSILEQLGFSIERKIFSGEGSYAVENFYATRKNGSGKHLLFNGHVDVVPAGDAADWTCPPFSGHIAQGAIFGRGATDMKGGIACFIAALARAGNALRGAVSLLLTADEEGEAFNGTQKALRWQAEKGEKWTAALVGEPCSRAETGDRIQIGRRGALSAELHIDGKQGHVASPNLADNPLTVLVDILAALKAEPLDKGNEDFIPSDLQITNIDTGNPTHNIIPDKTVARISVRFNTLWTTQAMLAELERRIAAIAAGLAAKRPQARPISYRLLPVETQTEAFIAPRNAPLIADLSEAVFAAQGKRPALATDGGASDGRFIKDYCPVAELGAIGRTMHQIDENADLADLEKTTQIYQNFLEIFFR